MFQDRFRHCLAFTRPEGILAAHLALQRGHLNHHVGGEIGLAQRCRPQSDLTFSGLQVQTIGKFGDQVLYAIRLIEHGAEFGLKSERRQLGHVRLEWMLEIAANEVIRIREASTDHMLIALENRRHIQEFAVIDRHKIGQ